MTSLIVSTQMTPGGSYVVERPARNDGIGDILRASFIPDNGTVDELKRLLALLDRPDHHA